MPRKSPFDVRSMDPRIVRLVLSLLRESENAIPYQVLDERIQKATRSGKIKTRSSRRMYDSDELVELEWLGIISRDADGIQLEASEKVQQDLESDLEGTLSKLLYSKELLYHLLIRFLERHGEVTEEEILENFESLIIDGRKFTDYGIKAEPHIEVRFNKAKLSYLKRIGRKLGQIEYKRKSTPMGVRGFVSLTESIRNPKIAILASYERIIGEGTFAGIEDLWTNVSDNYPAITETIFDQSLLELREEFFPSIDLFQGSGKKYVFDPLVKRYYHHIRVDTTHLSDIRRTLEVEV
jgi:hypothetical protein